MIPPGRAVFLSYASQDLEAANRIGEALRAAGIEVWFDKNELRGGDAWDQKIRREIKECALFVPIISAHTQSRAEGYFRLEWRLGDQRTQLMGRNRAFLVPVCVDDTREDDADVPDSFSAVQWTRLPAGHTPPAFVTHIAQLLAPGEAPAVPGGTVSPVRGARAPATQAPAPGQSQWPLLLIGALALLAVGWWALHNFSTATRPAAAVSAPSAVPEKSVAVLAFADMSEKKDQEYFSDGLTEEMIDLLSQVSDLRVPARTSSFYFKGKNDTIANIAQQLKVAHVLEGSVRKAGNHLRITAQLIRADNGYHLWSQTYDREDKDVFAVQDDIARAVVSALQGKLAAVAPAAAARGSANTEAYRQFLLGRQLDRRQNLEGWRNAAEAYSKAVELDPNYAAAYAGLGLTESIVADEIGDPTGIERARRHIDQAIALAPNEAPGYAARAFVRTSFLWDWPGSEADIQKALSLDPHNSDVQHDYAALLDTLGRSHEAIAAQKKATELDPVSVLAWDNLGFYSTESGDYAAAEVALNRALELEPTSVFVIKNLGMLRLRQGKNQQALETFRKLDPDALWRPIGVAMAEYGLGHARESQQALDALLSHGQAAAYQIAQAYAWRGETDNAFTWLDRAYRQRDGGLASVKNDPMINSLRPDPRFKALLIKMNLSD